jgi:rhamnose transport system substrate-binding protein
MAFTNCVFVCNPLFYNSCAEVRLFSKLDETGDSLVRQAMSQLDLSVRGCHRVLKLARTITDLAGPDGGQIAILSATSTAPNQNAWIEVMKEVLDTNPDYANLELVEVVYGDDDTKSYNEAQALFTKYPDLKVIIAPTTVGIAASARAVTDADLIGQVFVTGLGTPNQMREYVKNGASPQFALWNPADLGYLSIYVLNAMATGEIEGKAGDTFEAGRLGSYTIEDDPELGLNVLLGPPFIYNADNIDDFDW